MENKNCEILFEYLRSILYDSKIQTIQLEELDPSFQKLGKGLMVLQKNIEEMMSYSAELSKGNLTVPCPSRENLLCGNIKNLHAHLKHLTWQAKEVASGDYSQHVSYLGEFSEAFNTMTEQLKERESQLKEEAQMMQHRAEVIEGYQELFLELTRKKKEWICVVDSNAHQVLYHNKKEILGNLENDEECPFSLAFLRQILNWQEGKRDRIWEWEEEESCYQVISFPMEWRGKDAVTHIVENVTEQKEKTRRLEMQVYHDSGTGIKNRLYFEEEMKKLQKEKKNVVLCYMDLDGLKDVNDRFGHAEGDLYIKQYVDIVGRIFRKEDIFARVGGDEFCLILSQCDVPLVESRLEKARKTLLEKGDGRYRVSFSYGLVKLDERTWEMSFPEVIHLADSKMYEYKREHRADN